MSQDSVEVLAALDQVDLESLASGPSTAWCIDRKATQASIDLSVQELLNVRENSLVAENNGEVGGISGDRVPLNDVLASCGPDGGVVGFDDCDGHCRGGEGEESKNGVHLGRIKGG